MISSVKVGQRDPQRLWTPVALPKDRGHLALVEGGTPSIPDASATPSRTHRQYQKRHTQSRYRVLSFSIPIYKDGHLVFVLISQLADKRADSLVFSLAAQAGGHPGARLGKGLDLAALSPQHPEHRVPVHAL